MIITVTPNPSLDRTELVEDFRRGEVLRAKSTRLDPGGKGVNVSRALAAAGTPTVAVLPAGGAAGERLSEMLAPEGVPVVSVPIAGSTRSNIAIVEPDGTTTKINEPGPELSPRELTALEHRVTALAQSAEWVVFSGSLPPGAPFDFYARVIRRLGDTRIAVDTSGGALVAACVPRTDLIKPNREELAELAGRPLNTLDEIADFCAGLPVATVLVSLGADGALLVQHGKAWHATGPAVEVRSTVGAGDAMLAGFLHAGARGPDALRIAVAYGTAAVALEGSRMPTPQDVHPHEVRCLPFEVTHGAAR
ncbi:1-phosphofructokinase [Lentzea tibetensis]|uniref:1-phosphofructokinase n=1 Tax=Lentzea tibetensis TaxID=2591470 RepID=A0A563EJ65_9PSEU|nr:1-phosphofructokinase [Lentzea tibetensis]TWP46780.1 1-phosphofructokinase [Lentzea tibetensis]